MVFTLSQLLRWLLNIRKPYDRIVSDEIFTNLRFQSFLERVNIGFESENQVVEFLFKVFVFDIVLNAKIERAYLRCV